MGLRCNLLKRERLAALRPLKELKMEMARNTCPGPLSIVKTYESRQAGGDLKKVLQNCLYTLTRFARGSANPRLRLVFNLGNGHVCGHKREPRESNGAARLRRP